MFNPFYTNEEEYRNNILEGLQQGVEKDEMKYLLELVHVKKEDIEDLVHMCFTKGRIDNNPVQINEEDIKNILKSIF